MVHREQLRSRRTALAVVVVTAAVIIAAVLAPVVLSLVPQAGADRPSVAVVTLRGETSPGNVNAVADQLWSIRNDGSVEAVVIRIDSPGGLVTSSEEFYLAVNRTAAELPVVAYVEGSAASGGYYGIVPADEIVVKPSSNVGSIGVVVQAPLSAVEEAEREQGTFIRSGPDKAQISKDGLREDMETLKRVFVGTVMRHRADELALTRTEVANGEVYLGTEAVENGFADRIGDLGTAIQRAAEIAPGIEGDGYDVEYYATGQDGVTLVFTGEDQRIEGDVIYVESSDDREFVQPVKYYAIWGVPAEYVEGEEVRADG